MVLNGGSSPRILDLKKKKSDSLLMAMPTVAR